MMKYVIWIGGVVVLFFVLVIFVFVDIKLNDNFLVVGYVMGLYCYFDEVKIDKFDFDFVKFSFLIMYVFVMGVVSIYYIGGGIGDDFMFFDVYVNYDVGDGFMVMGGKFLSWFGFEVFDILNMY